MIVEAQMLCSVVVRGKSQRKRSAVVGFFFPFWMDAGQNGCGGGGAAATVLLLPLLLLSPEVLCRRGCWMDQNGSKGDAARLGQKFAGGDYAERKSRGFCWIIRRLYGIVRGKVSLYVVGRRWHVSMQQRRRRRRQVGVQGE
ncbi:hypothetical protein LY76DRAFT_117407 [Colletotrichum caudatum]|nr:hypothetical protein LY76DRAFT_117407 [Colletotrichum caudatum]